MTTKKHEASVRPPRLPVPPSKEMTTDCSVSVADDVTEGELSPIAILCDGIFAAFNDVPDFPTATKTAIGDRISGILAMFLETESGVRTAKQKIDRLKGELRRTKEQLAVLRQEHFDKSSEKDKGSFDDEDPRFALFDEEDEAKEELKGKKARKLPADIETIMTHHYPENMTCGCGHALKSIKREERVGRLRIIPEHVVLVKDVYHTCACNRGLCKENKPVAAKAQGFIMKNRGMEAEFAAEAACQKFFEHIPSFRMERRLANVNVNLSRQTIGRNIAHLSKHLAPVRDALQAHVNAGYVAHMDETPISVLNPGKGKCDNGYIWATCRDEHRWNPEAQPAVVYHYAHSRAGAVAQNLLQGASLQFLQTDGYAAYNCLFKSDGQNDGLTSVRCSAHARRKFFEISLATASPLANRAVQMFRKMYAVEKVAYGKLPHEREALRQKYSLPIVDQLHAELLKNRDKAQGGLRLAINYTLNSFDSLRHFIFDGKLEIDNNPVERCIRGIALTKKNSLFAGTHEAADVWAIYYSLIESARLKEVVADFRTSC
ncbi:IS66 family transposase [Yoonia sp. MH D7]